MLIMYEVSNQKVDFTFENKLGACSSFMGSRRG